MDISVYICCCLLFLWVVVTATGSSWLEGAREMRINSSNMMKVSCDGAILTRGFREILPTIGRVAYVVPYESTCCVVCFECPIGSKCGER